MPTIEIRRQNGWVDAIRLWRVLIDEDEVGNIRRLQSATFKVEPGHHTVQMRISLWGSPHLVLQLGPDERAVLTCRPRHRLFRRPPRTVAGVLAEAAQFNDRIVLERVR